MQPFRTVCAFLPLLSSIGLYAQPATNRPLIMPRGIVNAASLLPPGLPNGAIARGSLFTIFGARLGPVGGAAVDPTALPFGPTLAGVSVKITQGNTSVDAIPLSASPGQVTAIMPSNTPLGMVSVVVTFNAPSFPSPARIVNSSLGLFSAGNGYGPGNILNVNATDNSTAANTTNVAAMPGQTVILSATGQGPVTFADNDVPLPDDLTTPLEVFVGGKPATLRSHGRISPGIDQLTVDLPPDAPLGCWVPVQARTEGKIVSNTVTMAISADGTPCSEPNNNLAAPLLNGGNLGLTAMFRADILSTGGMPSSQAIMDYIAISFRREPGGESAFNPMFSLPPAGSCTAYGGLPSQFGGDNPLYTSSPAKYLDGGTNFSLLTPKGARAVAARTQFSPVNFATIGLSWPGFNFPIKQGLVLDGGDYAVNGNGGADVGTVRANFSIAKPFTWTNRTTTSIVSRAQGLTVNWSGAPSGQTVLLLGSSFDVPTNSKAMFVCAAASDDGKFTVPAPVLSALPPSRTTRALSRGILYVGVTPLASLPAFTATGLDMGFVLPVVFLGKDVSFQ